MTNAIMLWLSTEYKSYDSACKRMDKNVTEDKNQEISEGFPMSSKKENRND